MTFQEGDPLVAIGLEAGVAGPVGQLDDGVGSPAEIRTVPVTEAQQAGEDRDGNFGRHPADEVERSVPGHCFKEAGDVAPDGGTHRPGTAPSRTQPAGISASHLTRKGSRAPAGEFSEWEEGMVNAF